MANGTLQTGTKVAIRKTQLDTLISSLQSNGFETIGPRPLDNTISYAPISSSQDLPIGYSSEQERGTYRLMPDKHNRYFDALPGAESWKKYLFPPRMPLFEVHHEDGIWQTHPAEEPAPKYAFIGVRPCELAAIEVQDRVFIRQDTIDPIYQARRQQALIIVVNCLHPNSTCFCTSMGSGPRATSGFDLSLTELEDAFVVEVGSPTGAAALQPLEWERSVAYRLQLAETAFEQAERAISRRIVNLADLPDLLLTNLNHPRWEHVAARCLSCTSCTQACPTCFCWDTADLTGLSGEDTRRERVWDSCFNPAYSSQAGGNTRPTTRSRYRQWLSHKLGSWVHQFGVSGCVGCGRCITWCPAKIDITEEIHHLQEDRA